jgi:hypothetical protein
MNRTPEQQKAFEATYPFLAIDEFRAELERLEMGLIDISEGTLCRECGGEEQARLADLALGKK